jgi:hypothetical protein
MVYRYTSGFGIDTFCMIQQMSRARHTKKVNMLILDSRAKYHEDLCKKHEVVNEFGCTNMTVDGKKDFNINSIMTEIHYIKTWYDMLFNNNKIDIVKIIADKSYGYKITEFVWDVEEKYEFGNLKKIDKKEIIEITEKIFENEITDIPEKYTKCIDNLKEQIELRERYLKDINNVEELKKLSCDENAFKNHIYKKYLDLTEVEFQKKIIELHNKDVMPIIKSDDLINKISTLFWLEKTLNFKRLDINNIKIEKLDDIKAILTQNVERLYWFL